MIYQLGNIEIDEDNFKLFDNGQLIAVEPQVFDLIIYLIKHRDRLISRQELFEQLWTGREVSNTSLSNNKPDDATANLGFAIADQVIGNLLYLKEITVRPSGSIRQHEKSTTSPIAIAKELRADYLLMGNYLLEANVVRLNVELINVTTNEIVWHQPITVDYNNTFELQDIVAQEVAIGLNTTFTAQEIATIERDIPNNPLAYEYYLRSLAYPLTLKGHELAVAMLQQSLALDDSYAPAYAEIGNRLLYLTYYGLGKPEQMKLAEQNLLTALALNDRQMSALSSLALLYTEGGQSVKAMELTKKMLEINPNNAAAHFALGYIYRYAGLLEQSITEMELAVRIDPSDRHFRSLGSTYYNAGYYEKALVAFEIDQGSAFSLGWQGIVLARMGHKEQAIALFNQVSAMAPGGFWDLVATTQKAIIEQQFDVGLQALRELEWSNINDSEPDRSPRI